MSRLHDRTSPYHTALIVSLRIEIAVMMCSENFQIGVVSWNLTTFHYAQRHAVSLTMPNTCKLPFPIRCLLFIFSKRYVLARPPQVPAPLRWPAWPLLLTGWHFTTPARGWDKEKDDAILETDTHIWIFFQYMYQFLATGNCRRCAWADTRTGIQYTYNKKITAEINVTLQSQVVQSCPVFSRGMITFDLCVFADPLGCQY